jgi:hypothetical protein
MRSKILGTVARRRAGAIAALLVAGALVLPACLPPAPPAASGPPVTVAAGATGTLPAPPWWSGACDSGNSAGATALGASYRGVSVCGPRPNAGGTNRLVRFYNGAWGELEWQCVELAMRYMYLAYGVLPYPANGKDVYPNYDAASSGGGLVKIADGTVGQPPAPGDVISFGATATSSAGHVGVVESVTIDGNGDGTLRMLSQNDSTTGWRTLPIQHWSVNGAPGGLGATSGWLHKP